MARTFTTWDNDRSGEIDESNLYDLSELGSFVKSIALLPYLKSIGVDVLYFYHYQVIQHIDQKVI